LIVPAPVLGCHHPLFQHYIRTRYELRASDGGLDLITVLAVPDMTGDGVGEIVLVFDQNLYGPGPTEDPETVGSGSASGDEGEGGVPLTPSPPPQLLARTVFMFVVYGRPMLQAFGGHLADLQALDEQRAVQIVAPGRMSGTAPLSFGDIDSDGLADLLIGEAGATDMGAGGPIDRGIVYSVAGSRLSAFAGAIMAADMSAVLAYAVPAPATRDTNA